MTRLLLIGAAGLDWASFDAQTRAGTLPELAALRARGVSGWLAGSPQSEGPAAWATIATGLQPEAHGVWREQEEGPGRLRPVGKASWLAPPLWMRLAAAGISTGSVAWRASHPGADWAGVHLDDTFPEVSGRRPEDWALPRRCLPDALRDTLRGRRVHTTQITGDMIAPLVPDLMAIDQSRDDGLRAIATGMARTATIQSAAVWMLAEPAPDAVFVYHPWLYRLRVFFERRREPHFAAVIPAAWRFLDGLIGRLAGLAGPETLVMVVSPGWRAAPGVVLAFGAGVTPDPGFGGASLLDIAPTALGRFGLEDAALPGRRLAPVAAAGPLAPAPAPQIDPPPKSDALLVYGLRKHGYRPPHRPGRAWRADGLAELAMMMLDRDPAGAGEAAQAALFQQPGHVLALRARVRAHVALEQADPLPALGDALLQAAPDRGWGALAHGAFHVLRNQKALASPWLLTAEADPDPATLLTVAAIWLAAARPGAAERVFRAVLAKDPLNVSARIGVAMGDIARRDFMAAEFGLQKALTLDPGRPAIYLQLAQAYARSARKAEAARAADIAISLGAAPAMATAARGGRLRG